MQRLRGILIWAAGPGRRTWLLPLLVILVAAGVRSAICFNLPITPGSPDCQEYYLLAKNLREHGSYSFVPGWQDVPEMAAAPWRYSYDQYGTLREPGYPAVLSVLLDVVGPDTRLHQAFLILIDSLTAAAVFGLGFLLVNYWTGLLAGLLWAVNPCLVDNLTKLLREPLMAFLLVCALCVAVLAVRRRSAGMGTVAGIIFGLGVFVKTTLLATTFLVAIWMLVLAVSQRDRKHLLTAVAMVLAAFFTVSPWIVRNSIAYGRPTLVTTQTGEVLYLGLADAHWLAAQPADVQARLDPFKAADAVEADSRLRALTLAYVEAEPAAALRHAGRNLLYYVTPFRYELWENGQWAMDNLVPLMFLAACYGLGATWLYKFRGRPEAWLVLIVVAGMAIFHIFPLGTPRFRVPFDSLVIVCAAATIHSMLVRRWNAPPAPSQ